MPLLSADERFLRYALDLAQEAAAFASPNPAVGCVLARGEQILGQGAHLYNLRDHAEIVALKDAVSKGHEVAGATAYVTLEPCSHHGRTGPCAEALVKAGVAGCVAATADPNPLVRGEGFAKLRAAGIRVSVAETESDVAQTARRLNDAFAFSIQHERPFVTLKAALSADGMLAPSPASRKAGAPYWITGPAARAEVQVLRHGSDALLCGVGTVLADDPELSDRTGLLRRRPLLRVVLDRQLRTPLDSKLVRGAHEDVLLFAGEDAPAERVERLKQAGVEVVQVVSAKGRLDLGAMLEHLANRAIRSVLLEAGSALNGSMLRAGLVDRVILFRGPAALGAEAVPFTQGGPSPEELMKQLQSCCWREFPHGADLDTSVTGYLHDPWAGV